MRAAIRRGDWTGPTAGLAPAFTQANLVVLPEADAFDFLRFCVRNPKPCPVLEVLRPGLARAGRARAGADLRTDLPRYRVWREGELAGEATDVRGEWREDLVAFLIGCSFTFERALLDAGLPVRHVEQGVNVPMYRTAAACRPAGRFSGPLVVSMRPMTPEQARAARPRSPAASPTSTARRCTPATRPSSGSRTSAAPDYGDAVEIRDGEIPVFWACGVTPAGGRRRQPPRADDHPRARAHVRADRRDRPDVRGV